MSTIKVENIRIASEAVSRPVTGVAAAWVNFNGTGTIAIRDSVNVSSITDNGTGWYFVNISNSFGNVNYSVVGSGADVGNNFILSPTLSGRTVSLFNFVACINADGTNKVDVSIADATAHGELA